MSNPFPEARATVATNGVSDTIFAVAAGGAGAALTVLRISGSQAGKALDALCGRRPVARHASLRRLLDAKRAQLDTGVVLWFPGPRSYTGEDCAELHLHGGMAVLSAVANALAGLGARPAEPGEFTRRAFLNGKMDLTEAEAVADLVAAETDAQRRQALRQLDGELGTLYRSWNERLLGLAAFHEALIDFADEDSALANDEAALGEIIRLRSDIAAHLDDARRGERVRQGLVFAIVGPPNVGKSSLINALASREVAIVSPHAGTTRDVIEARIELSGLAITLLDTAGLRDTHDAIEREGVRRARERAQSADLVIFVCDARTGAGKRLDETGLLSQPCLIVANKIDLAPPGAPPLASPTDQILEVSAKTGAGIDRLRDHLAVHARSTTGGEGAAPLTKARHRAALGQVVEHLEAATNAPLVELRAEDIRLALAALGQVTGRTGVEGILDAVFSAFCIGK